MQFVPQWVVRVRGRPPLPERRCEPKAGGTERRVQTVIVDAANVVGSRPTGWWRDRAGAAAELVDRLRSAGSDGPRVVAVLEGQARAGAPAGEEAGLTVVHAASSGDDEVVEQARRAVAAGAETVVVTSDRDLARRCGEAGAQVVGASRLWDLLSPGRG